MASRAAYFLLIPAGVAGGAGVALAALAAHKFQSPALGSAAHLLMIHAAAAVGAASLAAQPSASRGWMMAGTLMLAGSALFAADMTLLSTVGSRMFPMAAPTGGMTMIAGWLMLAVTAALRAARTPGD